ncbi:hypothetical protein BO99DRAFT_339681, partial [Aspergillus violaceofuscus CBS 115571]
SQVKNKSFPSAFKNLELSAAAVLQHLKIISKFNNIQTQINNLIRQLSKAN